MRTRALYLSTVLAAGLLAAACQRADTSANSPATAPVDSTAAAAPAAAPAANPVTAADFVTAAAGSDMYEIAAAKVAQQKSKTAAIKAFAAKMIHDHSATTAEVKKLIASGKVKATPPAAMDDKHQGMMNDLNQAAPGAFDKTYMDQQVAAHTDALGVFQTYSSSGDNTDLKAFAAATAPKIQGHLDMAKQIDAGLK